MKIYVWQTYRVEKKQNGVVNHTLIHEGVLDHAEDVFVENILPEEASNDTSDRCLWDMQKFLDKNYPGFVFRYQEQEVDYRLSMQKAVKGIAPQMDDDIRTIGTGIMLAPATYAALIIGSTIKDMEGRAEAIAAMLKYFEITPRDIEIAAESFINRTDKYSWEKL